MRSENLTGLRCASFCFFFLVAAPAPGLGLLRPHTQTRSAQVALRILLYILLPLLSRGACLLFIKCVSIQTVVMRTEEMAGASSLRRVQQWVRGQGGDGEGGEWIVQPVQFHRQNVMCRPQGWGGYVFLPIFFFGGGYFFCVVPVSPHFARCRHRNNTTRASFFRSLAVPSVFRSRCKIVSRYQKRW